MTIVVIPSVLQFNHLSPFRAVARIFLRNFISENEMGTFRAILHGSTKLLYSI
jgi:hypothetical protein